MAALSFTGRGFYGDKEHFEMFARYDGLRSKKTRHIMKRAKKVIHKAILDGLEQKEPMDGRSVEELQQE